jgi:HSP20 family protein
MAEVLKREPRELERPHVFDRFDRMFDDWLQVLPFRRPMWSDPDWWGEDLMIRVDEFHKDGILIVRAELPGVDPDKDVELTVSDGMLRIAAERREEEKSEEAGYVRHEMRCGSFARTLPLPEGVVEADIEAEYTDGILEIRIPAPEPAPATKVPITKS